MWPPSPLPGQGRDRCGCSGRLIQLTNSRQDRCAIRRRQPFGGDGAPHGRGRGGDVTARPLTSGAPGQESRREPARLGLCSECVCVCNTCVSERRPLGDALALGGLHWVQDFRPNLPPHLCSLNLPPSLLALVLLPWPRFAVGACTVRPTRAHTPRRAHRAYLDTRVYTHRKRAHTHTAVPRCTHGDTGTQGTTVISQPHIHAHAHTHAGP